MFLKISLIAFVLLFTACEKSEPTQKLDAKKLIVEKCASCHNLDMPPSTYENEKAPPMMAVSFHVKNFVKPNDESQRVPKAIEFVADYVLFPSIEKSFCDKKSLENYGLMPSQKENLSQDEAKAIAKYMFEHYTQEKLQEAQAIKAKLDAMPAGEKLALENRCLGCHKKTQDLVGPSFEKIAIHYKDSLDEIKNSIKNGSRNKWESSRGVSMPAFHQLSDEELQTIAQWIAKP